MERSKQEEHKEDLQQRHCHSSQPQSNNNISHQYPTRFEITANEAETTAEDKEFVFLRNKGEQFTPVFKQFEFILHNELGEPRLDPEGKEIVAIDPSPNDLVSRVFLIKPDKRGNMKRA